MTIGPGDIHLQGRGSGSRATHPPVSRCPPTSSRFSAWQQPAPPKSGVSPLPLPRPCSRPPFQGISPPPPRIIHLSFSVPPRPFSRRSPHRSRSLPPSLLPPASFFSLSLFFWSTRHPCVFLAAFLSLPRTRSNVLVARGSSSQRPSCIPEPPHCSFLEGKRENISARRRRDARGESKVEGSRVEDGEEGRLRGVRWREEVGGEKRGPGRGSGPRVRASERERQAFA